MISPIAKARSQTLYSTTALAKHLEVSRQYLTRTEQGLYEKSNHKVLKWTADQLNLTEAQVLKDYSEWQWHHRFSIKESKVLRPVAVNKYYTPDVVYYHKLFREWRERYWRSSHEMCVDLCMHTYPVIEYEEGRSYKMPALLKEVMSRLGLIGEGFKTSER